MLYVIILGIERAVCANMYGRGMAPRSMLILGASLIIWLDCGGLDCQCHVMGYLQ